MPQKYYNYGIGLSKGDHPKRGGPPLTGKSNSPHDQLLIVCERRVAAKVSQKEPGAMAQERKTDHLKICAELDVEFRDKTTLLEDVQLVHEALTEISFDEVSTRTSFMGKSLKAPLMISAISGGVEEAKSLNRDLAKAAQELGIAFCLGSQRPMLENRELITSYEVRRYAPDILILGNLGIQQAAVAKPEDIENLVSSIQADGLAIHLNTAMELSQAEGDRRFTDGYKALKTLTKRMPGKIMVKETGCGVSKHAGARLREAGVRVLDTAGAGGTSWPRVEHLRKGVKSSERFWLDEWGIPTAASLLEVSSLGFELVGSGGIRSGLDAAKCLVLGADVSGMALPVLRAYSGGGYGGALAYLKKVIEELKSVMLLVGARDIPSLKKHQPIITGRLREWINSRK